ncbi:MAG: hypothetical protein CVV64_09535 [Candidatus Wallbacteria bacterium HGW-Wallbacteria-1]|jgi:ubiquinone/menaquinone biosynthesis C-methylase UbiE|uniref:Methyltransferase domain-containing protein n=1 Tax=Candidatus Wallbacteria bacterium HGW-Wallbacteria-1 TaxID=2013854 RepID=A0A2N1PQI4_9BACT|nr:MAG: hypothetical protein CVV64_09535 [Candidatus Wallbacteria bacterium HGW-Wallbacteria-1]
MYHGFSLVYDDIMRNIPYRFWFSSVVRIMEVSGCSMNSFLDLACGTGNIAIQAARSDLETWALDISCDMLTIAGQKASESALNIFFIQQDMRKLNLGRSFDCICCAFDSMNYVLEYSEFQSLLARIMEHLNSDGVLVFDLVTSREITALARNPVISEGDDWFMTMALASRTGKIATIEANFFLRDDDGRYSRYEEIHPKRIFSKAEIERALAYAGASDWIILPDYRFEETGRSDSRITVAASCSLAAGTLRARLLNRV